MKSIKITGVLVVVTAMAAVLACSPSVENRGPVTSTDALPSWNDGEARQQILDFVARVTDEDGPDFVPEADRPSLAVLVHHNDAEREYAYDRDSKIGGLDIAPDDAATRGWTVVSMRDDWSAVFP